MYKNTHTKKTPKQNKNKNKKQKQKNEEENKDSEKSRPAEQKGNRERDWGRRRSRTMKTGV